MPIVCKSHSGKADYQKHEETVDLGAVTSNGTDLFIGLVFFFLLMCICVWYPCTFVHVCCMGAHACMCEYIWRPKVDTENLP